MINRSFSNEIVNEIFKVKKVLKGTYKYNEV